MKFDISGTVHRMNRRQTAEERTPLVVTRWPSMWRREADKAQPAYLGTIHALDRAIREWSKVPARIVSGAGALYDVAHGLEAIRIVTAEDVEAIKASNVAIRAAQDAADKVCERAFRRGRRPTFDEIAAAAAQVDAEVGDG